MTFALRPDTTIERLTRQLGNWQLKREQRHLDTRPIRQAITMLDEYRDLLSHHRTLLKTLAERGIKL